MREKPEARGVQITACLLMGVGTRSGEVAGAGEQRAGERYAPRGVCIYFSHILIYFDLIFNILRTNKF